MKDKFKKAIKITVLIIAFLGFGFLTYKFGVFVGEENILGTPPSSIVNQETGKPEKIDFSIFWEAWRKTEKEFLKKEKINYQAMVYGAIKGMVDSLGDPYTSFFTPEETKDFEKELSGKYEGVGMVVGIKEDQLTVISPLKGSPAETGGLKSGDKIVKIEEVYTRDITIEEAVKLIKGPRGTEVRLLIQRKELPEPKEFKIKRELITIPTLEWELLTSTGEAGGEEGSIALIRIYQFNEILPSEFKKAVFQILNSSAKKIILDLRNNPGGYLEVAQEVAGWFLKKGDVVVWQDEGENKEKKPYNSEGPSVFFEYPIVVLINEGSASGAEILAGALRDQLGVKLIGETSFGKGSVQEKIALSDNSSLKITVAKWLTPKGDSIDEKGLEPDIKVEIKEDTENDVQLDKAIEIIKDLR